MLYRGFTCPASVTQMNVGDLSVTTHAFLDVRNHSVYYPSEANCDVVVSAGAGDRQRVEREALRHALGGIVIRAGSLAHVACHSVGRSDAPKSFLVSLTRQHEPYMTYVMA